MKMGAFSFLFGVGLLFEIGFHHHVNAELSLGVGGLGSLPLSPDQLLKVLNTEEGKQCFYDALRANGNFLLAAGLVTCGDRKFNDKEFLALYSATRELLVKNSCTVFDAAHLPHLEDAAAAVADPIAQAVVKIALEVTGEWRKNIPAGSTDIACSIVKPLLDKGCGSKFFSEDFVKDLKQLYNACKDDNTQTIPIAQLTNDLGALLQCGVPGAGKKRELVQEVSCPALKVALEAVGANPENDSNGSSK